MSDPQGTSDPGPPRCSMSGRYLLQVRLEKRISHPVAYWQRELLWRRDQTTSIVGACLRDVASAKIWPLLMYLQGEESQTGVLVEKARQSSAREGFQPGRGDLSDRKGCMSCSELEEGALRLGLGEWSSWRLQTVASLVIGDTSTAEINRESRAPEASHSKQQ